MLFTYLIIIPLWCIDTFHKRKRTNHFAKANKNSYSDFSSDTEFGYKILGA